MKGMVFDIKKYAIHDGPGIRTTIFLKGCPMNCIWCHNPESQKIYSEEILKKRKINQKVFQDKEIIGKQMTINEVWEIIIKDKIFYDESKGGVTFSGGEPLYQPEFVSGIAKLCKESGIHTAVDTCGYIEPSVIKLLIPFTDLFLYDKMQCSR